MSWGEPILGPLPRTMSLVSNGSNLSLQRSVSINATGRPYPPGLGWTPQVTPHDPEGLGAMIQGFRNPTKEKSFPTSARSAAQVVLWLLFGGYQVEAHNALGLDSTTMTCVRNTWVAGERPRSWIPFLKGRYRWGDAHQSLHFRKDVLNFLNHELCSISWITSYVVVAHLLQKNTTHSFTKTSTGTSDFTAILSPWTRQWRHSSSEEVDS